MDSLNIVALTGTLERTPTVVFTGDGVQSTRFTVCLSEAGKEGTVFKTYVSVECYGKLAEAVAALSAGDLVAVSGALKYRKYTDAAGQTKGTLCVFARTVSCLTPVSLQSSEAS